MTFIIITDGICVALYVARRNTAKADIAMGMELEVITAVVLGGTSIFGGRGAIIGTLLGVFMIHSKLGVEIGVRPQLEYH